MIALYRHIAVSTKLRRVDSTRWPRPESVHHVGVGSGGGLCASGWQVSALMMRLLTDTFRDQDIAVMGVAAVPEMRWKIPVFAGDSLHASIEVMACEEDSGQDGMGAAEIDYLNAKFSAPASANQLPEPRAPPQASLFDY